MPPKIITQNNAVLKNIHAEGIRIEARNVVLDSPISEDSKDHGILIVKGASAIILNPSVKRSAKRGIQADKGHLGLIVSGGECSNNINDGIGVDGGNVSIFKTRCFNNGLPNEDSRDGIQISGCAFVHIICCTCTGHHNAGIIGEFAGGLIANNICSGNRHGIALAGNRQRMLFLQDNGVNKNEFPIWFYQESPAALVVLKGNAGEPVFDEGISAKNVLKV